VFSSLSRRIQSLISIVIFIVNLEFR